MVVCYQADIVTSFLHIFLQEKISFKERMTLREVQKPTGSLLLPMTRSSPRAEELRLLPSLPIAQNIKSPSFVSGLKI